jgi:hypothetical protein
MPSQSEKMAQGYTKGQPATELNRPGNCGGSNL